MEVFKPGSLSIHLVTFCRFLRGHDFLIGAREEQEMFRILGVTPFDRVEKFQRLLSQLLCKSRQQQLAFPALFDHFWQHLFAAFDAKVKTMSEKIQKKKPAKPASIPELKKWLYNQKASHTEETAFYSGDPSTSPADLSHYDSNNIKEMVLAVDQIAKNWASKPGRRKIRSKSGGHIDLRQVMRRNLSTGEMIEISFRRNKIQKPRLVLVCDVSKSMAVFTNFTVKLLYAFQQSFSSIETFVFSTQLYRISTQLRQQSFKQALEHLSEQVPDWSGGTRIGHSLDSLIKAHGARLLHGKVIFLMVSDGWDTGDLQLLDSSLQYIKRRVKKLIWLNPQAGRPGFEPQVQGMLTALPYIDYLHGVHDLESLKDLRSKVSDLRS